MAIGLGLVDLKTKKLKTCLICCSVLKSEIEKLILQGDLDVDVVYVSKLFHVDYGLLEKNLRRTIERTLPKTAQKPVLVYGDLCLGPNGEMKQLARDYDLTKINALNCVDCLLGGNSKIDEADPKHELMFFDPGMIEFFQIMQKRLKKEGVSEEALRNMFSGIKGVVLLDTLGNAEKCKAQIEELNTGLQILDVKEVGLDNLKKVISQAVSDSHKKRKS